MRGLHLGLRLGVQSSGAADPVNLVANGTFGSDTTGWVAFQGTISAVGGRLRTTEDGVNSYGGARRTLTVTPGNYTLTVDYTGHNGLSQVQVWIGTAPLTADIASDFYLPGNTGTKTFNFTVSGTTLVLELIHNVNTADGATDEYSEWDNVVLVAA